MAVRSNDWLCDAEMMLTHHWIESMREAARQRDYVAETILAEFEGKALSAAQFDFGDVEDLPTAKSDVVVDSRAPYKLTMAQFSTPTATDQTHILVLFEEREDEEWFMLGARTRQNGNWAICSPTVVTKKENGIMRFESYGHAGNMKIRQCSYGIVKNAFSVIACCNVGTVDIAPPISLNRKRARSGKPPILGYKTLVLKPGSAPSGAAPSGGSHASPRVHLRRGHIRRLPTGNIWVQACVVGDKRNGMLVKDYKIAAPMVATHNA